MPCCCSTLPDGVPAAELRALGSSRSRRNQDLYDHETVGLLVFDVLHGGTDRRHRSVLWRKARRCAEIRAEHTTVLGKVVSMADGTARGAE
jgi:hypothetical protein